MRDNSLRSCVWSLTYGDGEWVEDRVTEEPRMTEIREFHWHRLVRGPGESRALGHQKGQEVVIGVPVGQLLGLHSKSERSIYEGQDLF